MSDKKRTAKHSAKQPRTRAKYTCPKEVKELIDEVNLVPFPINMINLQLELRHRTEMARDQPSYNQTSAMPREVLKDCLKGMPEDFQKHIKSVSDGSSLRTIDLDQASNLEIHEMCGAYAIFYQTHNETINYARRLKYEREEVFIPENWEAFPITASGTILRDEKGRNYLKGLAGVIDKIIPERFRMCEICNRIFWAKRTESKTCSPRCTNVFHQRRFYKSKADKQ